MIDPHNEYRQTIDRIAQQYDATGRAPWIFDDFRWLDTEAKIEAAFAAKSLSQLRGACAGLEHTATELLSLYPVIVGVREVPPDEAARWPEVPTTDEKPSPASGNRVNSSVPAKDEVEPTQLEFGQV